MYTAKQNTFDGGKVGLEGLEPPPPQFVQRGAYLPKCNDLMFQLKLSGINLKLSIIKLIKSYNCVQISVQPPNLTCFSPSPWGGSR